MVTLILCIGMLGGYCEEVAFETYPDMRSCLAQKILRETQATDFLMASCKQMKEAKKS